MINDITRRCELKRTSGGKVKNYFFSCWQFLKEKATAAGARHLFVNWTTAVAKVHFPERIFLFLSAPKFRRCKKITHVPCSEVIFCRSGSARDETSFQLFALN
jgi:hypothetical protein